MNAIRVLAHRGPDASCLRTNGSLFLGHSRLSIVDKNSRSNQPFYNNESNSSLIVNGEIVNFRSLQKRYALESEGLSDCKIWFDLIEKVGIESALEKAEGMFSGVYLDPRRGVATAFRDRFGIKPLYYYVSSDMFIVASEIKAILEITGSLEVDEITVDSFLRFGAIDSGDRTFYKDIKRLDPGCMLVFDTQTYQFSIRRWYRVVGGKKVIRCIEEAREEFDSLTSALVDEYLESDVSIGVNLSEGIDSSLLSLLLSERAANVNYYSIDFGVNELEEEFKKQTWIKGREWIRFRAEDFLEHSSDVARCQDEPYSGIFIGGYSKLYEKGRRKGDIVYLDGNGLDEIFLGYDKYRRIRSFLSSIDGTKEDMTWLLPYKAKRDREEIIQQEVERLGDLCDWDRLTDARKASLLDIYSMKMPRALRFNDHVSMQHGCELRVPFLDRRLLEFAMSLDESLMINKAKDIGKVIVRESMALRVGRKEAYKQKRNVQTLQSDLLQSELYGLVKNTLCCERFLGRGYVDADKLKAHIEDLPRQRVSNSFYLWRLLSLEWWHQRYID